MVKGIGHKFTLDELLFVQAMGWNLFGIAKNNYAKKPHNIRILILTFQFRSASNKKKITTAKSYICEEYYKFKEKRLMKLLS